MTGPAGIELRGMAVFGGAGEPAALRYSVHCDSRWHTTAARIHGWRGAEPVDLRIVRDAAGHWSVNGAECPDVTGCLDIDLSFTPATNLLPLRRLDLAVGGTAEVRSAWLEWPARRLSPLVQHYHRHSAARYHYEADLPGGERFTGELRVDAFGWVADYAGLWEAVVPVSS